MPRVSVVIPTHNRATSVRTAIDSVLKQTFQDFEILVVDDASEDDTEASVRGINDSRIRYFRHAVGKGDAGARNTGIRNSTGEYLAFLDDDDQWMPEKLSWQLAEFEKAGELLGLVFGGRETFFTATGRSSVARLEGDVETQLRWFRITTSTVMIRRAGIERVGPFDEDILYCSDYDLWIRLWRAGFQIACIDQPLVRYFVHGNGLTDNPRKVIAGKERVLRKHEQFFAEDPASFGELYRRLGLRYYDVGEVRKARGALAKALRLRPTLSTWVYYVLTFGGSRFYRGAGALRGHFGRRNG